MIDNIGRMKQCALIGIALVACAGGAGARQGKGGARAGITAIVIRFETAYEHKERQTLLMKLMNPTQDAETLEKRYQWLRGYGPKDMPGTKHPPILFETSKGSFVPTSYVIKSISVSDPTHGAATVEEKGTYRDEDGKYKVIRTRQFKLVAIKGKWYVADYVLASNTEDYGFYVDDIADKMTKQ
jgi:hypothetical protein